MDEPRKQMRVSRSTDRISSLPEDVIHEHIFQSLSDKDIKRMCCLSKTWYQLSTSFPILVFSKPKDDDEDEEDAVLEIIENSKQSTHDKYLNYINRTLSRFHNKDDQIICRVSIYLKFRRSRARLVDNWINLVKHHRFEEFNLCLSTPKKPYPMYYNLPPSVFSHPNSIIKVARFRGCSLLHSFPHPNPIPNMLMIKKLSLNLILMDETSLSSIISCCPLIEHLSIVDCMEIINCLRISRLHNLKNLIIFEDNNKLYHIKHSVSVEIEAPSLQTVDIKGSLLSVNIIGHYPILTDLALRNIQKVEVLDISSFPLLRKLCLFPNFSLMKQNLVSNKLNKSEIELCKNLVLLIIDASNLRSVVNSGYSSLPRLLASSSPTRWQAVISYSIHLEQTLKPIRDFLVDFSHFVSKMKNVEHLELHFQCDWEKEKYFTFGKELKRKLVQSPGSSNVENLMFCCEKMQGNHLTVLNVLDAVLWTCHPRILKITAMDVVRYMRSFATRSWYNNVSDVMYVTQDGTEYTTSTIASKTSFGPLKGEIKFIFDWSMTDFFILQRP